MNIQPTAPLTQADEQRLRDLAYSLAKGIEEPEDILKRLSFTTEDYKLLSESYTFKSMLTQAVSEWQGASNIQKRIKLKAAVNIEEGLPNMFFGMTDDKQPLASRVKAFEIMARIAGVGQQEVGVNAGVQQAFRLEINLGKGGGSRDHIVIDGGVAMGIIPAPIFDDDVNDELIVGVEGEQ